MKAKNIVLTALIFAIVLAMVGYEYRNRKKDAQYRQKIAAEQDNILLELGKLENKIKGLKGDLKTLDLSSKDYIRKMQEMMGEQTQLQIQKEIHWAGAKQPSTAPKVAVVSIQKIFQECKRSARYREEAIAERDRVFAELAKLRAEIEAEEAGLRTLKAGSSDHLASMKEILVKQANFQAQQEFHKQQMALKQQRMIEGIYGDILRITDEVAEQKSLDLVLEKSEPELPASSANELERTIGTHKLLYSGGCLDITDEVMARIDAGN